MTSKSSTRVDEDELGYHAEGLFDTLCREVGAMATPPGKDKVGWDFYVVLPHPGGSLLDGPPRLNCSVQVKAQWSTTQQGPPIKLSNWEAMISDPNPWFVFVLLYDRPKQPVRGALVHVDEAWTTRVMKRLWKNAATANADLSDLSMRVRWTDADILPLLSGEAILRTVRDRIGDASKYLENKRRWKTEAGIGPVKHTITVRFRDEDVDYAQLARAAIGDDASGIEFPAVQIADVRFGIPIPKGPPEASKLSFVPKPFPEKATIIFTSASPVREDFSIDFDAYSPTSVLPLPDKYRRLRLVSPLLRFEISPGPEQTTSYRWDLHLEEAGVRLDHLVAAARAMRVLLDPESPPYRLDFLGKSRTVDAKSPSNFEVPEETLAILDAAIDAGIVARSFGLALDQLAVRPRALARQEQNLRVMAELFSGTTLQPSLKITNTDRELDGRRVGHVVVPRVRIGDRILVIAIGLVGPATWTATEEGGDLTIAPSIRVLERKIIAAGAYTPEHFNEQVVQPLIDRGEAMLDRDGLVLIRVERSQMLIEALEPDGEALDAKANGPNGSTSSGAGGTRKGRT